MSLLDFDALQSEFLSCDQIHLIAPALRTLKFPVIGLILMTTIFALETCPNPLKMESGPLGNRFFADDVPVELYRFTYDGREVADDQVDASDPPGITRMT